MSWLTLAKEGFGVLTTGLGSWLKGRAERKKLEVETKTSILKLRAEAEIAKAQSITRMAENSQAHEINWDMLMAENSKTSWKDEVMMLAIIGPYLAIFHPMLQPYVIKGFAALDLVPDWYLMSFGVVVAASFGYRGVVSAFNRFGNKVRL